MTETNWSLGDNGAAIADVSNEAAHVASSAANLLSAREDLLWITGDAPQHVTIELSRSHPPLLYAGWHVWHDYLTNPKTVELASGETYDGLAPLIICQALPGEGTQVWRLPGAGIPSNHRFVRFRITETFGPGPTYMNNVVLLAADPGPNYQTSRERTAAATALPATAAPGVPYPATLNPRSGEGAGAARGLPPAWNPRARPPYAPTEDEAAGATAGGDSRPYEPLFRGPSPSASSASAAPARRRDDSVGVFRATREPSATGAGARRRSASSQPADNTGRMSQLLRDLDDDIKLLKPIKSVSPTKNMLLYVPQETPQIPGLPLDEIYEDVDSGPQARSMSYRSAPSQPARQHGAKGRADEDSSAAPPPPSGPAASMPPGAVYYITQPPQPSYTADIPHGYQERLSTLEQAVASLAQSVQHQREDLTMIKRLLLQQATERRREAERRLQSDIAAPPPPPPPSAAVPDPAAESRLTTRAPEADRAAGHAPLPVASLPQAPPFTTQHVAVDFPEDALRSFVQSVMAEQVKKQAKKTESRVLHRLDEYLKDVVDSIANSVDDRVRARLDGTWEPSAAASAQRVAPTAAVARKAGHRRGNEHPASPEHGSPGHPSHAISIVKDSSFDTSGSGARQHRY